MLQINFQSAEYDTQTYFSIIYQLIFQLNFQMQIHLTKVEKTFSDLQHLYQYPVYCEKTMGNCKGLNMVTQ